MIAGCAGGGLPPGAQWVPESIGTIPAGAVAGGREADGAPLFLCRAAFRGALYPGKVRAEFRACNIGYRGMELPAIEYEVLAGDGFDWVPAAASGVLPARAVRAGAGPPPRREPFYICRGDYRGGVHPGRTAGGANGCAITWGGDEVHLGRYQVLARRQ